MQFIIFYKRVWTSPDITDATIDDKCKVIGGGAIYDCNSLLGVIIPDSVISTLLYSGTL